MNLKFTGYTKSGGPRFLNYATYFLHWTSEQIRMAYSCRKHLTYSKNLSKTTEFIARVMAIVQWVSWSTLPKCHGSNLRLELHHHHCHSSSSPSTSLLSSPSLFSVCFFRCCGVGRFISLMALASPCLVYSCLMCVSWIFKLSFLMNIPHRPAITFRRYKVDFSNLCNA